MKALKFSVAAVFALILSTGAFAGTPKTTDATASPSATVSKAGATYYWFPTDNSGTLSSRVAKSNSATSDDPTCNGDQQPCGLGYDETDTHIDGSGNRILNDLVNESMAEQQSFQE